jgi:hypothetical protein
MDLYKGYDRSKRLDNIGHDIVFPVVAAALELRIEKTAVQPSLSSVES